MIIQTQTRLLNNIREIFHSDVNDVVICEEVGSSLSTYYTLLIVKKHEYVKKALTILGSLIESSEDRKPPFIDCFAKEDNFCFLFEYKDERPVDKFYMGNAVSLYICEQISRNLVAECISCSLPYPFLYLILNQNNVHIEKDNRIYFTCFFDLLYLNPRIGERDCVNKCADLVLELLSRQAKRRTRSYELISKKAAKKAYNNFTELYRDIKLSGVEEKPDSIFARMKAFYKRNRDKLFHILLFLCISLAVIALLMLLSQLIFGDAVFFNLFKHSINKIGTESLK